MTGDDAFLEVVAVLEDLKIPYMVVGSLSSNYYGVSRATKDADIVIELEENRSIREVAERLGTAFRLDPQMSFETVTMTRRHAINVPEIAYKIELFYLSDDVHDQERFRRRVRIHSSGRLMSLPTPEDVVVTKLRWVSGAQRGKDWDDIRNVIAIQGDRLDWEYIHRWAEQHGTRATLDEIRATIPPI